VGQRPGPAASVAHARRRAVLAALLLLIAMLAASVPSSAADMPKPLTPRRLFDQSRPGVQLITVQFSAGLVVPDAIVTETNGRALEAIAADKVRRGEIPATAAAASGAMVDEIARDPFRWFTASSRVHRSNVKLTATGSGFSISPDGYIVTNAHVVAPKDDNIKAAFLARAFRDNGDDFVAAIRQEGLTQRQATRFLGAIVRWSTRMTRLANYKRTITVLGSTGGGTTSSSKRRAARLVDAGEEFPGKDVALVKVDARNMATVQLGDDTALSTGDRLFVLGFPGAATFNPVLSKASQGEPTLTQGVLSAKKQVNGGYTVLQTDAGMTHGNSGGPVFDEQGRVIGVATLGSVDPNTGQEVSGLNFAVPASIVNELLRQTHVTASDGTAGETYREALDDYDRQWYKRALPLLQRVKALDPGHPLVGKLIKDSQTAIAQGRDHTPREILGLPVPVAAGLAGVVVVLMLLLMLVRRRRRKRDRGGAPAGGWTGQPGGWDTRPPGAWPTQPADAQNRGQNAAWGAAPGAAAWGAQPEPSRSAQPEPAWDAQQEAAWNHQQQGAWNGGAQQTAWNGGQQAGWNDQQQANGNDRQHAAWSDQQQSAWSDPRQETWSAQEQGAWEAQEQVAWGETGAGWGGATESPADAFGYGYGDGASEPGPRNGHNGYYGHNGSPGRESSSPTDAPPATEAVRSWWDGEESRTAELPTVKRAQPAEDAEPSGFDAAPTRPRGAQGQSAQGAYNQCGNCGVRNHPSLRYCEQCWAVLIP
jgi:serine protease Do